MIFYSIWPLLVWSSHVRKLEWVPFSSKYLDLGEQRDIRKSLYKKIVYGEIYLSYYDLILYEIINSKEVKAEFLEDQIIRLSFPISKMGVEKYKNIYHELPLYRSNRIFLEDEKKEEEKHTEKKTWDRDKKKSVEIFNELILESIQTILYKIYKSGPDDSILEKEIYKIFYKNKGDKEKTLISYFKSRYNITSEVYQDYMVKDYFSNIFFYYEMDKNWKDICDKKKDLGLEKYYIYFYILSYSAYIKRSPSNYYIYDLCYTKENFLEKRKRER